MSNAKIYITLDLDWLSDEYLAISIDILAKYGVKATIFATHDSRLLRSLDSDDYEIGLHPNFDPGGGMYNLNALYELHKLYPQAVGTRSHTLLFGSRLLPELERCHMKYESNIFMYMHEGLHCVARSKTITSVPFNWSDDKHLELEHGFATGELPPLDNAGLNVFNFHPVHIYLNTDVYSRYESSKANFNNPGMAEYVNRELGVRNLFEDLCSSIANNGVESGLLSDLI